MNLGFNFVQVRRFFLYGVIGCTSMKTFIITKQTIILLLLILFVGSWLRFDGAGWGLPHRLHPDEGAIVDNAINMAHSRRFEVYVFNRPDHVAIKLQTLIFWAMHPAITAISIAKLPEDVVRADIAQFEVVPSKIQKLPPKVQLFLLNCFSKSKPQITLSRENSNSHYVMVGRALSALFGVICIFLAWLIGKQIHKNVGIICALLFALYSNFIEHSHYITPEIYQTAFTLAMTYFAIIYIKNQEFRVLFLACLCAALAFCTKYPALFSFPIIIASIIYANSHSLKKQINICLIAFITFGICVFAISPILILDLPNVYFNVMSEARSTHLGADGLGFWGNLLFYLKCYANHSGIIIVIFTIFGFISLYKENKSLFLLLLLGALYAPIIAILALHWDRWGVPFYVFALIFASIGIWKIFEKLVSIFSEFFVQHKKIQKEKLALSLIAVVLLAISFLNLTLGSVAKTMYFSTAKDTRIVSMDYVSELGATNSNTFYEGYTPLNPTSPATIFGGFEGMDISKPSNPELKYIILSSTMYSRYYAEPNKYSEQIAFYDALKANKKVIKEFKPITANLPGESSNDIKNIVNSLLAISGFLKGGYSGPTLIFYEY